MEHSDALSGKSTEEAHLQRQLDVDFTSVSARCWPGDPGLVALKRPDNMA